MSLTEKIKIVLADDHQLLRTGLKNIIEQKSNLAVIGEASNGREAIKVCGKLLPDVVIIDVSMPDLNGIEAAKQISKIHPNIKIIALSMHSSKQFIQGMFNAGAYAYLLKDGDSEDLVTAINTVTRNMKYLAKELDQEILTSLKKGDSIENAALSTREKEVLQLIAEGNSSKDIGEVLFLSSKTVDVHRNNIMKKLDLFSISELTKYAIRKGLTSLDT
ncbi:DNA-binding response regulator [Polaribacter sp. WD7]|uniref:response regulator n=1 Tax=Polaribacter sp. WD7 TaxID=2269061 RepID=UPI000DF4A3E2|nr:response regulator transcription factor [Polaribacter sp. WD7]RCS26360.1 DNA-binding response regulator [Polaribacter sp. WD7]